MKINASLDVADIAMIDNLLSTPTSRKRRKRKPPKAQRKLTLRLYDERNDVWVRMRNPDAPTLPRSSWNYFVSSNYSHFNGGLREMHQVFTSLQPKERSVYDKLAVVDTQRYQKEKNTFLNTSRL